MSNGVDVALLVLGGIRIAFWLLGIYAAARLYRWLPVTATLMGVGFGLATIGSAVFAFSNAGVAVPEWMFTTAAVSATPAAALITSAVTLLAGYYISHRQKILRERRDLRVGR